MKDGGWRMKRWRMEDGGWRMEEDIRQRARAREMEGCVECTSRSGCQRGPVPVRVRAVLDQWSG